MALTTSSVGNATLGYYAFGRRRTGAGSTPTRHQYTGQYIDDTLLYNYGARYYDPELGIFLSPDTLVPDPSHLFDHNRYMYVRGNPLRFNDPTGHTLTDTDSGGGSWSPEILELYSQLYQNFTQSPIADLYDGDWNTFVQDFLQASEAVGASNILDYGAVANHMADTLAGRGKFVTGIMPTNEALRFYLYGQDQLFRKEVAEREAERVAQLTGMLSMGFVLRGALGSPCSFTADTLVATENGLKPIDTIAVNEQVLAYDEALGRTGFYPVSAVMSHEDPVIIRVTIAGEVIETTPEHPFYVVASAPWLAIGEVAGRWQPAGELAVGDAVKQANGATGVVQALEVVQEPQVMYNLTVADARTFFVGEQQWLVHNQCAGGTYRLVDPNTGETMYVGRTSNLARRAAEHSRDPAKAHLDLIVDLETNNYAVQRGREQMLYEQYNPPLNRVQPISPLNPRRNTYLNAARRAVPD